MKLAVHVHIYYADLWPELEACLRNIDCDYDLFVTSPLEDSVALKSKVLNFLPDAEYRVVENRGYDVAPFLDTINRIDLSTYDYVIKLHTKRNKSDWVNYYPLLGGAWRRRLLGFCSSRKAFEKTIRLFQRRKNVGMVADGLLIVGKGDFLEKETIRVQAKQTISALGLSCPNPTFVAGTMFIIRANLLQKLQNTVSLEDFPLLKAHEEGTLAHVYERVLGYLVTAQGFYIDDFRSRLWVYRVGYWPRVIVFYTARFIFRTIKSCCGLKS